MPLQSLLYVGRSAHGAPYSRQAANAMAEAARVRASAAGLTGALLLTGTCFAQVLEGWPDAIDAVLDALEHDPEQADRLIVSRTPIVERRFAEWRLAYFGPSLFVARHVTQLLESPAPCPDDRAADWLIALMHEFSARA